MIDIKDTIFKCALWTLCISILSGELGTGIEPWPGGLNLNLKRHNSLKLKYCFLSLQECFSEPLILTDRHLV